MKKILFTIALFFILTTQAWSATCTAQGAGDWWTAATWNCGGETRVPAAGDDVALAGYIITWDVANGVRIPATSGDLGTITSAGTAGQITVDLSSASCNGDKTCTIHATSMTAGTKPTNAGLLYISGAADVTDILGVYAAVTGGSNTNARGITNASSGSLYIEGAITAGSGQSAHGLSNDSTGQFTVVGNVTGSAGALANGIYNASSGTGTITGDVTGGSGNNSVGVTVYTSGTITLTGNLINGTGGTAWSGKPPTWNPTATYGTTWYVNSANKKAFFNETDPTEAKVETGTSYVFGGVTKNGSLSASGGASASAY